MDKNKFKRILFKVAFCTMACDGHIDKREIEELRMIDKTTSYFADIDMSDELKLLVDDFKDKGVQIIEELFELLRKTKLNPIQELLILEVALRIANADERIDENEIKFINFLRSKLELHDETINDRFGNVDILHTNEYSRSIKPGESDIVFIESLNLQDLPNTIDISKFKET